MIRKLLYKLADWVNENRRLRARVQQLLEANNLEVAKCREAERFANRGTTEIPERKWLKSQPPLPHQMKSDIRVTPSGLIRIGKVTKI